MLISIEVLKPDNPSHKSRVLHLKCDACEVPFQHRYKKAVAEKERHYCCRRCAYDDKKINNVPMIRSCECIECGKKFESRKNTTEKSPRFCSISCSSRHLNLVSSMQTTEVRKRAVKTRSARWADGTLIHPCMGRRFEMSDETKKKISDANSGEKNSFYGKKHTDETKQKMREARSNLITSGKMNWKTFKHKTGTYLSAKTDKSQYFRSSWEETCMKWLDQNTDVISWEYESVRIPYYYNDNRRWYIPDFVVTFSDGHREMWEIKPREFVGAEKVVLKTEAAQEYCRQNDIERYVILTRDDVNKWKHDEKAS